MNTNVITKFHYGKNLFIFISLSYYQLYDSSDEFQLDVINSISIIQKKAKKLSSCIFFIFQNSQKSWKFVL